MAQLDTDNLMIRYLLGEVSEREQTELEGKYFSDDEYFELFLSAEEELIDAYVRGELSAHEREQFERRFLATPQQCQRVEFARGLRTAVVKAAPTPATMALTGAKPEATSSWWQSLLDFLRPQNLGLQIAMTAAAVAVVLGAAWLLVDSLRKQRERESAEVRQQEQPSPPRTSEQQARNDQSTNTPQQNQAGPELAPQQPTRNGIQTSNRPLRARGEVRKPPRLSIASFVLSPGLVRDTGESNELLIPPGTNLVRLQLDVEGEGYQSYSAALETIDGTEIWQGKLTARSTKSGKSVVLRAPANLLSRRDYILTLRGATAEGNVGDVSEYSFRVVKK